MNRATVERLERLEADLDFAGREAEALQAFRLKLVAQDAERITTARAALAKDLADAKKHGATLAELAEVTGLSIEGVRKIIQKGEAR